MTQYYLYLTSKMSKEELLEELSCLNLECEYEQYFTQDKDELATRLAYIARKKAHVELLLKTK